MWVETLDKARRRIRQLLFWALLVWPAVHIVAAKTFGFSTWRLFGWGMYATPDGDSLSALSIVWLPGGRLSGKEEYRELYRDYRAHSTQPLTIRCFNAASMQTGHLPLEFPPQGEGGDGGLPSGVLPSEGLCADPQTQLHLAFFRHFRSLAHLAALVRHSGNAIGMPPDSAALVVMAEQHLNPSRRLAYTENAFYEVSASGARFLGKFDGASAR